MSVFYRLASCVGLCCLLVVSTCLHAQNVGINQPSPDPDAVLDVVATDKGVLLPRIDWNNRPTSPVNGLLLYVESNCPGTGCGFYYFDGAWIKLGAGTEPGGNAGGDLTGAYPNPDVADGVIDAANIIDGQVGSAEIATDAVGNSELADDVVGNAEMRGNAIGNAEMRDNAIGTVELIDGAVTPAKINPGANGQVLTTSGGAPSWGDNMPAGDGDYIQNQNSSNQSADFRISGSGQAGSFNAGVYNVTHSGGNVLEVGDDAWIADVNQGNVVGIRGQQNSDRAGISLGTDNTLVFGDGGNLGIGTTSPDAKLDVQGDLRVSNLGGSGNRKVYADANGVLNTDGPTEFAFSGNIKRSPDDLGGFSTLFGDDATAIHTLGFNWTADGVNYPYIVISTNGWIAFRTAASNPYGSDFSNDCLPSSAFSDPLIAAYWDDTRTYGIAVRYRTEGSSPNRVCIIDYQVETYSGSLEVTYQVSIHETSGLIQVNYRSNIDKGAAGESATIGFQTAGGSSARTYPISCLAQVLDDNSEDQGAMAWSIAPVR